MGVLPPPQAREAARGAGCGLQGSRGPRGAVKAGEHLAGPRTCTEGETMEAPIPPQGSGGAGGCPTGSKCPGFALGGGGRESAGQADTAGKVTRVFEMEAEGQYIVGVRWEPGEVQAAVVSPVEAPYMPLGQGRQDSCPATL
jgi:hypothetical protein